MCQVHVTCCEPLLKDCVSVHFIVMSDFKVLALH